MRAKSSEDAPYSMPKTPCEVCVCVCVRACVCVYSGVGAWSVCV